MKRKMSNVWWFFLIAFIFTWLFELPRTLDSRGILVFPKFLLDLSKYLPALGPFVAAFFMSYLEGGKSEAWILLKRAWDIKFRKVWWLPIFFLIPAMEGISVLLAYFIGDQAIPEILLVTQPKIYLKSFFGLLALAAFEEFGWRGYALDRLQSKWNALVASLVLAAFWGPWHLQQWIMGGRDVPFLAFWYGICMHSILFTWYYNNTKRSLLPVILVHALMNAQVFPTWNNNHSAMIFVIVWTLVTTAIIVFWKPKRFVRTH
jgi:membrane protease YdiL (CAAX protease family)